jgi:hypothetical protein
MIASLNCFSLLPRVVGVQGSAVTVPDQPAEKNKGATPRRRILAAISVAAVSVVARLRRYSSVLKRAALSISLISLAFSGVSLYETVLKQPSLQILAGCNWEYGRGPGSYDEFFVVPITVANHGARAGAVLAIELTASNGEQSKAFVARFTIENLDEKHRRLFAPLAVSGHDSETASIIFTQQHLTTTPLVHDDGRFRVSLKLTTALDTSYGVIDRMFAPSPPEARFEIRLAEFDIGAILSGTNASLDACGATLQGAP